MTTPITPALVRVQESIAVTHRLAVDAAMEARAAGVRDGINLAADVVDVLARAPDIPEAFVTQIAELRDVIRLLAYQVKDPKPIQGDA